MQLHQFGQTGLSTTKMGLGMAALGRPGYINLGHSEDLAQNYDRDAMQARAFHVLDKAWELGVRYFDTARSYGLGELFLGNWLRQRKLNSGDVVIGSKWGYTYTADWKIEAEKHEVKEHTLPVLNRQWEESQQTLGKYLNLYQIHSATLDSGVLSNVEVLNRLAELKSSGVLIGLSLSGEKQGETLQKALTLSIDGESLFNSVQATYNILETSVEKSLQEAHREGWGIIIKEALANGRLTDRNQEESFSPKMDILTEEASIHGISVDALSIAYLLSKPWVDIVLSGAARQDHLTSNLMALTMSLREETTDRLNVLAESPAEYWGTRKKLAWN